MKVKQTIKKVGAAAASTLLVGSTLGAAASLADFPGMFVDDDGEVNAQVVVGDSAKVADVVGAVNVAAALGQATVQTEEVTEDLGGAEQTTVNGTELEEGIGGATPDLRQRDDDTALTFTADDVPQLFRGNIDYNDNTYFESESVMVDGADVNFNQNTTGNDKTSVDMSVAEDALTHTVSFTPAIPEGATVQVAGQELQFIGYQPSASPSTLTLGATQEATDLTTGDSVTAFNGEYRVEVGSPNLDGTAVQIRVYQDGERITATQIGDGQTITVDEGNLDITGTNVFVSINEEVSVSLDMTWKNTVLTSGEQSPLDNTYTTTFSATNASANADNVDKLSSLTFTSTDATGDSDGEFTSSLSPDSSYPGPMDAYNLEYTGLSDADSYSVSLGKQAKVTYTDANNMEHTVNLQNTHVGTYLTPDNGDMVPVGSLPVTVESFSTSAPDVTVDFKYKQWDPSSTTYTVSATGSAGTYYTTVDTLDTQYGQTFDLVVEYTETSSGVSSIGGIALIDGSAGDVTGGSDPLTASNNLADNFETGAGGLITPVAEVTNGLSDSGETETVAVANNPVLDGTPTDGVVAEYDDDGTIDDSDSGGAQVVVANVGTSQMTLDTGEKVLTDQGSMVNFKSDSSLQLTLTQEQVFAHSAIGESTTTTVGGESVTYTKALNADVVGSGFDMAMTASEVQQSTKQDDHLILVGGPAVNTLVGDLAANGDTWDMEEWRNSHQDEALLQVVEDAFSDGQHAMIVAGWEASDTRSAAKYISNWEAHQSELADDNPSQEVLTSGDYPSP